MTRIDSIRPLVEQDITKIAEAFETIGWNKPASKYVGYLNEQIAGARDVLVAWQQDHFCGYLTIKWVSAYVPFQESNIPEISDFNVLPVFQRRRIGTLLMDEAERLISERSSIAGIGVGMDRDYGPAQRLYVLRGYIPDGRGLTFNNLPVTYGQTVTANEHLILYFTKGLQSS